MYAHIAGFLQRPATCGPGPLTEAVFSGANSIHLLLKTVHGKSALDHSVYAYLTCRVSTVYCSNHRYAAPHPKSAACIAPSCQWAFHVMRAPKQLKVHGRPVAGQTTAHGLARTIGQAAWCGAGDGHRVRCHMAMHVRTWARLGLGLHVRRRD